MSDDSWGSGWEVPALPATPTAKGKANGKLAKGKGRGLGKAKSSAANAPAPKVPHVLARRSVMHGLIHYKHPDLSRRVMLINIVTYPRLASHVKPINTGNADQHCHLSSTCHPR
jgi:hypothetical protein